MNIYVVYGVNEEPHYPSGYAEVHYVGEDKQKAIEVAREAKTKIGEYWAVNIEVWKNGKLTEKIQEEIC
ncbi:hypothetical protein [Paenibacillus apis]|uniref:Uncharacterized protein n=1 Tax=Paenibacillus apis TaxID=1792174 RepID=A0A920CMV5_9BACL|nr:hypothetical protein [Paenibacillus apis]GIO42492.1 hypothetical protein J41TS4_22500 [Paenibacillus apis]